MLQTLAIVVLVVTVAITVTVNLLLQLLQLWCRPILGRVSPWSTLGAQPAKPS